MFGDRYFGKRYFGNRYFGPGANVAPALHQPGGGYYRRPIIYVDRDGKPVDLDTYGKVTPPPEQPPLTPEMIAALLADMPVVVPSPVDPMASIMAKMGSAMIARELDAMADDDAVMVLLLS